MVVNNPEDENSEEDEDEDEAATGGVECNLYHPTLEETLDSFHLDSHETLDVDARDPVHANYEWVEEVSFLV